MHGKRLGEVLMALQQAEESELSLTAKDAGHLLGMTRKHILGSDIPQQRQGRTVRYLVEDLRRYVKEHQDLYE